MHSTPRILVVDDDRCTRELMKVMLMREGYDLLFSEDGKDAVEKAAAEKPDVVLMDGLLPKLHGFLACKAIKEQPDSPKVILVTGVYTKPTYKWEAKRDYQADDVLLKPLNMTDLLASIEKQLSEPRFSPRMEVGDAAEADQPVSTTFAFRRVEPDELMSSLRVASEG